VSKLITAARPYAKALFEVASQGEIRSWLPFMQLCASLDHDKGGQRFLNNSKLSKAQLETFLQSTAQACKADIPDVIPRFIAVLAHNKRFNLIPDIARLFVAAVNRANKTLVAEIISAMPFEPESERKLIDRLMKKYGKNVKASITIDASLLGGAVIKINDTVIDGSVKGRLQALTKALN